MEIGSASTENVVGNVKKSDGDVAAKEKASEIAAAADGDASNASMGVNEVTSSEDPTPTKKNDSSTGGGVAKSATDASDKSDVGGGGGKGDGAKETGDDKSSLPICKHCNFVFESHVALNKHEDSENHKMVVNGFKPSLGEHYCFLCWRGYNRTGVLQSHYNGPSHAEEVKKQGVKAIWKKADASSDHKEDEFKCPACNLVFVSEQSEQNHRQSERHEAVIRRQKPSDPKGRYARYSCYLCWHGFEFVDQLCRHYDADKAHSDRMRRYGVKKLLIDERLQEHKKGEETTRDSKRVRRRSGSQEKMVLIDRREYILVDEWSEEKEKSKEPTAGKEKAKDSEEPAAKKAKSESEVVVQASEEVSNEAGEEAKAS